MQGEPRAQIAHTFLGGSAACACHLVEAEDLRFLFDCGLDDAGHHAAAAECPTPKMPALGAALPLDAVFVSSADGALALPSLLRQLPPAHSPPPIFCTHPTLQLASFLLHDLAQSQCTAPSHHAPPAATPPHAPGNSSPSPSPSPSFPPAPQWTGLGAPVLSHDEVEACLALVTPLAYHQRVEVVPGVIAECVPSGLVLGACNWVLVHPHHWKFVYVAASCAVTELRPPCDLDLRSIAGAHVALLACQAPPNTPPLASQIASVEHHLEHAMASAQTTVVVSEGGWHVLDTLRAALHAASLATTHAKRVHLVCAYGDELVRFGDVVSEYMSDSYKRRAYDAHSPLEFAQAVERGGLVLHETASPALCLALRDGEGGPSCVVWVRPMWPRCDELSDLVSVASQKRDVALIVVAHLLSTAHLLHVGSRLASPLQRQLAQGKVTTVQLPLDVRLTTEQQSLLIRRCKPQQVFAHALQCPDVPEPDVAVRGFVSLERQCVALPRLGRSLLIPMSLVDGLGPERIQGQACCPVVLSLGRSHTRAPEVVDEMRRDEMGSFHRTVYGQPSAHALLARLKADGMVDAFLSLPPAQAGPVEAVVEVASVGVRVFLGVGQSAVVGSNAQALERVVSVLRRAS